MPIARYTQEIIDMLRRDGESAVYFDGARMTQAKARSRLTNAASRAGLRVSTQVFYGLDRYSGRVIATVIDTETTPVIE